MAEIETAPQGPQGEHEIGYEVTDLHVPGIVWFGVFLVIGTALIMVGLSGLYWLLNSWEEKLKKDELPPAVVDENRLPPEPRLEMIEDIREGQFRYWTPRAADYLKRVEPSLQGKEGTGVSIDKAMEAVSGRLPVRKSPGTQKQGSSPSGYQLRLPSRASSGRTYTGDQ